MYLTALIFGAYGISKGGLALRKILFIGDYFLYKEKFLTTIHKEYQINFLDSLSMDRAYSIFLSYDMIILDHSVLKEYSYTLCNVAKQMNLSVLFLFSKDCIELDILHCFSEGADDYIYPSLSTPLILLKKIELILSRTSDLCSNIYQDSHMFINFNSLTAIIGNTNVDFTPLEFKLLKLFIKNSNTILTRQQIIYYLWDKQENYVAESSLNSIICRIRRRIDTENFHYIRTIYGVGYIWNSYLSE